MKKIKVAVIGAGSMAREHIRAFQALEGVSVAGIYSRTKSRAEALAQEFNISTVADSIDGLYHESQANLVVVTVPELQANAIAKACFQYDWTVLLEKPAGYDLLDANDIAEAALTCSQAVFVGFNRRFYASARAILEDLDSRDEPRFIHIQDQQSFAEARQYNHPEAVVQKFMYANSIHNIDLIRFFGRGEIVNVQPILPWQQEKSVIVLSLIEFDSGDKALYEGIWQGPGPWACAISTPARRWMMQPLEKASYQNVNERKKNELEVHELDQQFKAGFYVQAQEICKAIRGEKSQAITIQQSLKTMELIHQMFGV